MIMDGLGCKVCGHEGHNHSPNVGGEIQCLRCPDSVCQDGPDGRAYRERVGDVRPARSQDYDGPDEKLRAIAKDPRALARLHDNEPTDWLN